MTMHDIATNPIYVHVLCGRDCFRSHSTSRTVCGRSWLAGALQLDRVRNVFPPLFGWAVFVVMTVMFIMSLTAFTDTQFSAPVVSAYGALREGGEQNG